MDQMNDLSILKNEEELIIKPYHSGERFYFLFFKNIKIFLSILSKI